MNKISILGIKVDPITYQEALERSRELLDSAGKHYIVTPNPEMIVAAQNDSEFKEILNSADLSIADGSGLVKMAQISGKHLPERVAGVDFVEGLAGMAEEFGFSMFFLGGGVGVAESAALKLKMQNAKCKIKAANGPALDPSGKSINSLESKVEREIIGQIADFKTDILVVAFGAPKQEKWIVRNLPRLNVKLAIGVGGALDYISGSKKRAPILIQKANLEWLYRLITEPRRIKRQLALPYFGALILKDIFSQKKNPS